MTMTIQYEHKDVVSVHDLRQRVVRRKDLVKTMIIHINNKHLGHTNQQHRYTMHIYTCRYDQITPARHHLP